VARYSIALTGLRSGIQLYDGAAIALAPDGSRLVYVGGGGRGHTQLWIRDRNDLTPRPLAGTEGGDGPFFSPDGKWIGYFAGGRLFKVPVGGGTPPGAGTYLRESW
jgi:serine/threonine-protein kinase